MSISIGHVVRQQFAFNQTDLLAPTSQELYAAADGFIEIASQVVGEENPV